MLGICYLYGYGTKINSCEAFNIFSSLPNLDKAQYQLGKMYLKGIYVRKNRENREKGEEILRSLSDKGCDEALDLLAG